MYLSVLEIDNNIRIKTVHFCFRKLRVKQLKIPGRVGKPSKVTVSCKIKLQKVAMYLSVSEIDNNIRIKIVLIHAVRTHQGVTFQLHEFINSAVDGSEWSASRNGHLLYAERAPDYALNRRLDGLHSWCRHFRNRKTSPPCTELNHGPVLNLVAILTELCQLLS